MYFIMLRHPNGNPMPVIEDVDEVKLFGSENEAEGWCSDSEAAQSWGYEIYKW